MSMERICPKDGSICPAQIHLKKEEEATFTRAQLSSVRGVAESCRVQARTGKCGGAVTRVGLLECDNSDLREMRRVYRMQRRFRGHLIRLPEDIFSIPRGEW
jgi:hypothetical protein